MSKLKTLLEGLPIKVLSKDEVELYGFVRKREYIKDFCNSFECVQCLGARLILRMMDEFEEPAPKEEKRDPFNGPEWDESNPANIPLGEFGFNAFKRDLALRDELRRLKGSK